MLVQGIGRHYSRIVGVCPFGADGTAVELIYLGGTSFFAAGIRYGVHSVVASSRVAAYRARFVLRSIVILHNISSFIPVVLARSRNVAGKVFVLRFTYPQV